MRKSIFFVNVYGCTEVSGNLDKMFSLMDETGTFGLQLHISELMSLDGEKFKSLLKEKGMRVDCVHVTPRLLSEDEEIFEGAVRECEKALSDIALFDCKRLMVVPFTPSDVKDRTRARERFAKALRIIVEKAKEYGISVIIENISQQILPFSSVEDVEYLLDTVKGLGFCFDTGNFVCTKYDSVLAYEKLKDRICMVHVKDFAICQEGGYMCDSGIRVKHTDFGKGDAKLDEVLTLLYKNNPDIPYVIEVHNEMPPKSDVVDACRFFDKLWEECKNDI